MAENIFNKIYEEGSKAGILPVKERRAKDWFRSVARNTRTVHPQRLMTETIRQQSPMLRGYRILGNMYCFFYTPKLHETLPYYDYFPLVFPIDNYDDGFLGLNMHYLPPILRARFMDALYGTINNEHYDETTKLSPRLISYNIISGLNKYKYFRPCIKRYLFDHVKGKYLKIDPKEWEIALFLPMERFVGAKKQTVWTESRNIIRKNAI